MRLSSVLASAVASLLLVVGVGNQTGRLSAGVVAGGVLAIDPNAVFFGTELRPYSAVMLSAVLATWAAMVWLDGDPDRRSLGGARYRLGMLFWICVAALLHPTSLGVLAWLVPLTLLAGWVRGRLNLWRADAVAALVVVLTLGLLAMSSLPDSWAKRGQWKAFGQATDPMQLWYGSWSWVPIVIAPLALGIVLLTLDRLRVARGGGEQDSGYPSFVGLIPMLVGVVATAGFFLASYAGVVPLWHRRYFVAALPLLAWSAGVASTFVLPKRGRRVIEAMIVCFVLGFLGWSQKGFWAIDASGRWPVQSRGEPWREAVAYVKSKHGPGEAIWIDTGLIEANFFFSPMTEAPAVEPDWEYLSFPVRGPYRLDEVMVVSAWEHVSWLQSHAETLGEETQAVWFIGRRSLAAADRLFGYLADQSGVEVVEKHRLGQLVVVKGRVAGDRGPSRLVFKVKTAPRSRP